MAKYRKYTKEFKLQAARLVTEQGINLGDNLSFTILIDFSGAGEYTLNNGTVMPYTEGILTFMLG